MDPRYDWLNIQIDRLQVGESLAREVPGVAHELRASDAALLMMAAQLNGSRPGVSNPDGAFVADLRSRLKGACPSRRD